MHIPASVLPRLTDLPRSCLLFPSLPPRTLTATANLMHKTEHTVLGAVLKSAVDTIMHHSEALSPLLPPYQAWKKKPCAKADWSASADTTREMFH